MIIYKRNPLQQVYKNKYYYRVNKETANYTRNTIPFISSYKYHSKLKNTDNITYKYYVTDYYQLEYTEDNYSQRFTVKIEVGHNQDVISTYIINDVKPGDNSYVIPVASLNLDYGDYWLSAQAIDKRGLKSMKLYHEFMVYDKNAYESNLISKSYTITDQDLATYEITKLTESDYDNVLVDIPEGTSDVYAYLEQYASSQTIENGKYINFLADTDGDGFFNYQQQNWFHWRDGDFYAYTKYSDTYDRDAKEVAALKTAQGLRHLIKAKIDAGFKKIIIPKGFYRISYNDMIEIAGDNIVVDFNDSIIKANKLTDTNYSMCGLFGYNSKVINANFVGCVYETDYGDYVEDEDTYHETGHGVMMLNGAKYSSFENVTIKDINGYGVGSYDPVFTEVPYPSGRWLYHSYYEGLSNIDKWKLGNINSNGQYELANDRYVYDEFLDISGALDTFVTFQKMGGFGGILGGGCYIECHFYDENYNHLGSEVSMQFRNVLKMKNAKFVKIVAYTNVFDRVGTSINFPLNQMYCVNYTNIINCYLQNCYLYNIRCVGACAFGKNCFFDNVTIEKSGYAEAHQLFDAEDLWERLQDFTIINCNIEDGVDNSYLLLCSGVNTVITNSYVGFSQNARAKDTVIQNCIIKNFDFTNTGLFITGYPRIKNNVFDNDDALTAFTGYTGSILSDALVDDKLTVIGGTNTFKEGNWGVCKNNGLKFKNLEFDFAKRVPGSNGTLLAPYENCILNNLSGRVVNANMTKCIFNNCNIEICSIFNGNPYTSKFEECTFNNCIYTNSTGLSDEELFKNCIFNE